MAAAETGQPVCISQIVTTEAMRSICNHFTRITKVGFALLDRDGVELASSSPIQDFCDLLRGGGTELARRCADLRGNLAVFHENVLSAMEMARSDATTHQCFLGFLYTVKSIQLEADTAGFVVLGPYLPPALQPPAEEVLAAMPALSDAEIETFYANSRHLQKQEAYDILSSFAGIFDSIADYANKLSHACQVQYLSMEENYRLQLEKTRELEETKLRLEELDKLKSNLLSTISHELRTPLTSIIGYSEMLLSHMGGPLNPEQTKFVRTIVEKGGTLLNLINKILDVASIEAGRFEVNKVKFPIRELVESVIEKIKHQTSRHDVKIEYGVQERLNVIGDPYTIEKAIYQVIENAVKFSPLGGVVQIQVRKVQPHSDAGSVGLVIMAPMMKSVEIMVRDFGPGIPEGLRERIFEPFFQVDDSVTRKYGGLGLGLALVKQYIWANGGTVSVESQEGKGTTFRIRLPLCEEP